MRITLDTNVLVAAMRSRLGASYALLKMLPSPRFEICLTVGLYTEWQSVLCHSEHLPPGASPSQMLGFLRYLCSIAHLQSVFYLWRPFLRDPDDDMVLECAVASGSQYIVTHNIKDFQRAQSLGIISINPSDFLNLLKSPSPQAPRRIL